MSLVLTSFWSLPLPILGSLQMLVIDDRKTLNEREFAAFLHYSSQCTGLEVLRFFARYTLPQIVPVASIPPSLISRNVKVFDFLSRRLNFKTGRFEDEDSEYFRRLDGEEGAGDGDEPDTRTASSQQREGAPEPSQRNEKKEKCAIS